jgi:hypothetical protein
LLGFRVNKVNSSINNYLKRVPGISDVGPDVVVRPPPEPEAEPDGAHGPPRAGVEGCPFQPRVINYTHLPDHLWPTLNLVIPANFQDLVVGQVLVIPVRMTVQIAPTEEGL